jgi:hypothetical protein
MWILVAIPLLITSMDDTFIVATYETREDCELVAKKWNSTLEFVKRKTYREFACWHRTNPRLWPQ